MIIAFDGNVFVGKTTLIERLVNLGDYNIIPEYSNFVKKIKKKNFLPLAWREHMSYLLVDALRDDSLNNKINLLDRSFVSQSAHIFALYKVGGPDLRPQHLKALADLLSHKDIIIPDIFIFVTSSFKIAKKRFDTNHTKGTKTIYIEPEYFRAVDNFNRSWQKGIGAGMAISNGVSYKSAAQKLTAMCQYKKRNRMTAKQIIDLTWSIFFADTK